MLDSKFEWLESQEERDQLRRVKVKVSCSLSSLLCHQVWALWSGSKQIWVFWFGNTPGFSGLPTRLGFLVWVLWQQIWALLSSSTPGFVGLATDLDSLICRQMWIPGVPQKHQSNKADHNPPLLSMC